MCYMKTKIKVVPVIPSLNPDQKLIDYVSALIKLGFEKIIIVNDGSSQKHDKYFDKLIDKKECIILKHTVNKGKGSALKTAFNYYLENFSNYDGVVTADSDGQHSPEDTLKVALKLSTNKNSLVLGTRDFNEKQVPFKSRYGNKITTFVFKLFYDKKINDTQTGLRGLSKEFIKTCLVLPGERFDYEINMLIEAVDKKINIIEETIETIYIGDNASSSFNPLNDSIRIYKVMLGKFLKFYFSGIFSFIVDIMLFILFSSFMFNNLLDHYSIIISTAMARIISSLINYTLNRNVVFGSKVKNNKLLFKYYSLCIIKMIVSALLVSLLFNITIMGKSVCKIIVDMFLLVISYKIQQKFIFIKESSYV